MNVALFASSFHPHLGGVEELVRQLAREYRTQGHAPVVVTNRWPPELPEHEVHEGTPVHRIPMRIPEGRWRARLRFALTHRRLERHLADILRHHNVDVVHIQCVSSNGYYARRAACDLGVPLVATSQGERTMDAEGIYERSAFLNATLRDLLANADVVTACSRDTLEDLERYNRTALGSRGRVIYNGILPADFDDPAVGPREHPRPYVLGIGRLVPQKGFDVLVRAFARAVKDEGFDHDLLVAGEGPEHPQLAALAAELCPLGRVHLLGRADRREAVRLFKGCSFVALPSRREPFGIVNLEAMAAGKAVVASAVGGVPEIVRQDENGLLVEPGDVTALAAALTALASDDRLRLRLAANGRAVALEFTWPRIAAQYLAVYDEVTRRLTPAASGPQSPTPPALP